MLILDNYSVQATPEFKQRCKDNQIELTYLPPNCTDIVQPIDAGLGAAIKNRMNKFLDDDMEKSEARADAWFNGDVTTSERRILYCQWLADAHEQLDSETIQKCWQRTGCCLDMNGKQNDLVHIDQVLTFQVPKLGDPKMKKLTPEELVEWELKETAQRTREIMERLE